MISRSTILFVAALGVAASATHAAAQDTTLTLGEAVRLAAQRATPALISHLKADEVRSRVVQREADLLPSFSATFGDGERTYNTASFGIPFPGFDPDGSIIGPVRNIDARARFEMNVFDPAALARYRGARSSADSAAAGESAAADAAAVTAAAAYLRVLRADAQLTARAADSSAAAQLVSIAQDQLSAGVGVALDVTRAQSQLAAVRSQLIAARNERDQSQLALRRALGMSSTAQVMLRDSLTTPAIEVAVVDTTQALSVAMRTRPELRAAAASVTSAERARDAARAARLPSVGIFADDGLNAAAYTHLKRTYDYGVQFAVPVFDGRRTAGRVEEQSAVLREAQLRLNDLRQQVEMEVASALVDLRSASEQVQAAAERLRLAEAETTQARDRFTAGISGNADVITALLAVTGSRTQLVDAEAALRMALVALARAQGTLLTTP